MRSGSSAHATPAGEQSPAAPIPNEQPRPPESVLNRFTLIWHTEKPHERTWVEKLFRPYIKQVVVSPQNADVQPPGDVDDCLVCAAFVQAQDPRRYSRFRGKNAFLIHFLDETYERHYDVYQNFKGVFRNFWSSVFNPDYVRTLPLGPLAGVGLQEPAKPALRRRYVWSFIGQANKSTRVDALRQLCRVEPHFVFATDTVPGIINGATISGTLPPGQYSEILGESIFAPSPMGNVNLECYRVYDALECGAIPIVERRATLDYFRNLLGPHPLPTVRNWVEARELIAKFLKSPLSIAALQQECLSWWAAYAQKYTAELGAFLGSRLGDDSAEERPLYDPVANTRWWQIRELMKHHDASALRRRAQLQASRVLSGRGLRVAFRPGNPEA